MEEKEQKKLIALVHGLMPELKSKETVKDVVLGFIELVNKKNIALDEALKARPAGGAAGSDDVLAGLKRVEDSLRQLKDQFATMRQYGIGMPAGAK